MMKHGGEMREREEIEVNSRAKVEIFSKIKGKCAIFFCFYGHFGLADMFLCPV